MSSSFQLEDSLILFIFCNLKYLPKITCLDTTDCDIQLFSPTGTFENPTTPDTNHTCRVLINAPPALKIRIQANHIGVNSSDPQSTYIMVHAGRSTLGWFSERLRRIRTQPLDVTALLSFLLQIRDTDALKTNVFAGQHLFQWHSSGNMAEVEFHGDFLKLKASFRAEYHFSRR